MHFVQQKYKLLIKTKQNRKWKFPRTVLEIRTLCFSSYENRKLKVKLWQVGALEKEKRDYFVPFFFFFLSKRNFFNICVLSQFIVYWIHFHFQNIHTFTYQKTLLDALLLLVFKILKSLQCILKPVWVKIWSVGILFQLLQISHLLIFITIFGESGLVV